MNGMREIILVTLRHREGIGYFYRPGALNRIVAESERLIAALTPEIKERTERVIDILEDCVRAEEMRFFASIALRGWNDWAKIASEAV
jgi:hypothetical protein